MGSQKTFVRKIIYAVAIGILLIPLFYLSQPATSGVKNAPGSPGGVLAQMRDKYELSPARLGDIDPTSATIKLATFGLSGLAANILREKANDYQMKKDFVNLYATLNQLIRLQPNFISVWTNQAWNLSYNISVQFDDYRERYRWVIRGFQFLKEGMEYNRRQPRLQFEMGRFVSQKIGKADERKEYRQLFRQDDDFNRDVPLEERDNWLVGKKWYERAMDMVAQGMNIILEGIDQETRKPQKGTSYLLYRSSAPMCQMYYSEALERDGTFGQRAKAAWDRSAKEWHLYGDADIPTFYKDERTGELIVVRLNDQEMHEQEAARLTAELEALEPGLREKIIADKTAALSKAQRDALNMPLEKRAANQKLSDLANQAAEAIGTSNQELARRIKDPDKRAQAVKLADEIAEHERLAVFVHRDRDIVNFANWRLRAEVERSADLLEGRQLIYQAGVLHSESRLSEAREAFEKGFAKWREVLDAHKELIEDSGTGDDLMDVIKEYRRLLHDLDQPFPKRFILQDVWDAHKQLGDEPAEAAKKPPAPAKR